MIKTLKLVDKIFKDSSFFQPLFLYEAEFFLPLNFPQLFLFVLPFEAIHSKKFFDMNVLESFEVNFKE